MIFEDVHWLDPTSLEALGRTVDRLRTLSVLLIVTFRPEFEPPWIGRPYVTGLMLNRLGEREIAAMIDGVIGNKPLPESIRQDIIERTDGVPLFVEEMTKAVLEAESQDEAQQTAAAIPSPSVAVPASLHASLMARLDRLGAAKEVAQTGAVIGREFSHALLAAVARKPEGELETALDRLVEAGLLFQQGEPPHATYLFKHALVQDAAYGILLRERRRALHARIAETLESQFIEIAENRPELLARHYTEAGLIEKAAGFWGKAGQRSVERSALVEAVAQLTRALDQIETLPSTPALRREQIRLQAALITPLVHVKGYTVPETKAAIEQARLLIEQAEALGEPPEDPLLLFSVLYGVFISSVGAFDGDVLRDVTAHILELAERQAASFPRVIGHNFVAFSSMLSGELADARAHFDQAIALYDPDVHRHLGTRFGEDQNVPSLTYRGWALWLLGYPEAALRDTDSALKNAREIGQAATLMWALQWPAVPLILCGHYSRASAQLQELGALAEKRTAPFWTIAWQSMCATDEGALKGEQWCKKCIWGNLLPEWKRTFGKVDNIQSGEFIALWTGRIDHFADRYSAAPADTVMTATPKDSGRRLTAVAHGNVRAMRSHANQLRARVALAGRTHSRFSPAKTPAHSSVERPPRRA